MEIQTGVSYGVSYGYDVSYGYGYGVSASLTACPCLQNVDTTCRFVYTACMLRVIACAVLHKRRPIAACRPACGTIDIFERLREISPRYQIYGGRLCKNGSIVMYNCSYHTTVGADASAAKLLSWHREYTAALSTPAVASVPVRDLT